jgi:Ca-activated chloride channel family protein
MNRLLFYIFLFLVLAIGSNAKHMKQIDDWDNNATVKEKKVIKKHIKTKRIKTRSACGMGGDIAPVTPIAMMASPAPMMKRKMGLAVGGAKDTDNFIENIKQGYIPKIDSITYEGTYYQHYFDTGLSGECKSLFCPSYTQAIKKDIYTGEKHYYLSVGLNSGINEGDFERKKLNLVVVLDISGSMGSQFNSYYYDKKQNSSERKSKMEIANETIVSMLDHLKDDDSLGVVLFDDRAYPVKPLRKVAYTDMKAIKKHILDLKDRGGTDWSAGYRTGLKYFDKIKKKGYENRIIFITDAMPNSGELSKDRLFGMAKKASKQGIHTTFIGVGVDFNANLVEYVSKTKGANYYSVHSSKEFKKRMDKEFDYMVTPLVYDLELKLASKGYKIDAVYGSPQANLSTGSIMKVNTLFPSASDGKRNKGGVILLRLKKTGKSENIKLNVSYMDTKGKRYRNVQKVHFISQSASKESDSYDNNGIRKAILLSEYVTLMKNWIIDARAGCNDKVKYIKEPPVQIMRRCMIYPPVRPIYPKMKTWERKSCKLHVSAGYQQIFSLYGRHYKNEMKQLGDRSLHKELDILKRLLKDHGSDDNKKKVDDWYSDF